MKVSFSLTLKEYYRYQLVLFRHFGRICPWILYLLGIVLAILLLLPTAFNLYEHYVLHFPISGPLLLGPLLMILGIVFIETPLLIALFTPLGWLLYRQPTLEIDPEGVRYKQRRFNVHVPWLSITLIEEDERNIYVGSKLLSFGRMIFVMIPKHVFSSADQAQAFADQARTYREKAGGGRPPQAESAWPPAPISASREHSRED